MPSEGILGAQIDAMLEMLEQAREAHCRRALEAADAKSREIVARSRREARVRVTESVRSQRRANRLAVDGARAEIETEQRSRLLRRDRRILDEGWVELNSALVARWNDVEGRRAWTACVLGRAREVLPPDGWVIRHPPDLDAADRRAVETRVHIEAAAWSVDFGSTHGVRVERGAALVDGTPSGLLALRQVVEARFLAVYFAEREGGS